MSVGSHVFDVYARQSVTPSIFSTPPLRRFLQKKKRRNAAGTERGIQPKEGAIVCKALHSTVIQTVVVELTLTNNFTLISPYVRGFKEVK